MQAATKRVRQSERAQVGMRRQVPQAPGGQVVRAAQHKAFGVCGQKQQDG